MEMDSRTKSYTKYYAEEQMKNRMMSPLAEPNHYPPLTDNTSERIYIVALNWLSNVADIYFMKNDNLVKVDLVTIFATKLLVYLKDLFGLIDQQSCHFVRNVKIIDAKEVRPGDIIFTPDHNYVIVKAVKSSHNNNRSSDCKRISIEVVHAVKTNLLASKTISKTTFSSTSEQAIVAVSTNKEVQTRIRFVDAALRSVGNILLHRSKSLEFLEESYDICSLQIRHRRILSYKELKPGDIILFTNKNLIRRGIVVNMKNAPNNVLHASLYHITDSGFVAETESAYNLDQVSLVQYVYNDLDSVIRNRVLYTADQTKGKRAFQPSPLMSMKFVLGCMSGDFVLSKHLRVFIGLQEIKLKTCAFKRVENIAKWIEKNTSCDIRDEIRSRISDIDFNPIICVLSNTDGETKPFKLFDNSDILEMKNATFTSLHRAKEKFMYKCRLKNKKGKPIIAILMLTTNETHHLSEQDKSMVDLLKEAQDLIDSDVIFTIQRTQVQHDFDVRKEVSEAIQKRLMPSSVQNTIYPNVFFEDDSDIQKRIALLVEQIINRQIQQQTKFLETLQNEKADNGREKRNNIAEYAKQMKRLCSFVPSEKMDAYSRHKIEVVLQRNPDVSAFSYKMGKMQIFAKDDSALRDYVAQFISENNLELEVKPWPGDPRVDNYHLKQGSKISRTTDHSHEYGTLGLFVRDAVGNTYFTTCGHVIPKSKEAFTETGGYAVGKSLFAPEQTRFSLVNTLDLSLVRVYKEKEEICKFGLRNPDDKLITGSVSAADACEMEDMKVYKWGASTQLTRGTYKGSICVKKGEKFDSCIHYIEGAIDKSKFAKEGDSGSLICFEATGSPQFPGDTAAFIFVGKCNGEEYVSVENESFPGYCYQVSDVFNCSIEEIGNLEPIFQPNNSNGTGSIQQGSELCSGD
ncbi:uncharacterized protein LOC127719848 [Mytilus californianus]|uniref:uncharacterized protein LOC127719848 n=1 Tax=Mytilus californianus TaxID=6549 RepID=UPI00224687E1|nr:uncharacterized protein LOC127719848 [Mytilus californianus]XP_052082131.1 uncharacterized protein LOC127719848 [Mytilus californianus]